MDQPAQVTAPAGYPVAALSLSNAVYRLENDRRHFARL